MQRRMIVTIHVTLLALGSGHQTVGCQTLSYQRVGYKWSRLQATNDILAINVY